MTSLTLLCDICTSIETGYTGHAMEARSVEEACGIRGYVISEARAKRALAREFFGVDLLKGVSVHYLRIGTLLRCLMPP